MKRLASITTLLAIAVSFSSCIGDHSSQQGKDTIKNSYQVQADSAKLDTGVAKSPENSASGGTMLVKKTVAEKQDSTSKAIK
jgi:hypothetical protein